MFKYFSVLLSFLSSSFLFGQQTNFHNLLQNVLPNATIESKDASKHFSEEFVIRLTQNLDHNNPSAGQFQQLIYLSHYDVKAPTVIITEGYSANPHYSELSSYFKTNQIQVEYRFFGQSKPENYDYRFLTNDQAAADLHRIRQLFGNIYKSKWIATGISKGGTTTLIYKSKYPKDIDIAVPIVGPLPKAREDKRCDDHILSIGTDACRASLADFQKRMLRQKDVMLPRVKSVAKKYNLTFNQIGIPSAYEYAVLEFTFSFWQYGHDCARVTSDLTDEEAFSLLNEIVGFDFYSDAVVDYFKPSFYQFLTENGYYGFIHEHVKDELSLTDFTNVPFGPKVPMDFDQNYMIKVRNWLYQMGDQILYIHGGLDPWGACRDRLSDKRDAHMFILENGDHTTRISSFSEVDQKKIQKIISNWLK